MITKLEEWNRVPCVSPITTSSINMETNPYIFRIKNIKYLRKFSIKANELEDNTSIINQYKKCNKHNLKRIRFMQVFETNHSIFGLDSRSLNRVAKTLRKIVLDQILFTSPNIWKTWLYCLNPPSFQYIKMPASK